MSLCGGRAKEIWVFLPPYSIFMSVSPTYKDVHKAVYNAVTDFCIYPSWVGERRKVSSTHHSQVGLSLSAGKAVKFSPFHPQWMWKMRAGIVVTREELLFLDNFSAIFICQWSKGIGNTSAVTAWLKAHKVQLWMNQCARKDGDGNNQFKCHWWMKCQTFPARYFKIIPRYIQLWESQKESCVQPWLSGINKSRVRHLFSGTGREGLAQLVWQLLGWTSLVQNAHNSAL